MDEREPDCSNCKHGWIDDHWGIPMCHYQDHCWEWNLWEPKEEQEDGEVG